MLLSFYIFFDYSKRNQQNLQVFSHSRCFFGCSKNWKIRVTYFTTLLTHLDTIRLFSRRLLLFLFLKKTEKIHIFTYCKRTEEKSNFLLVKATSIFSHLKNHKKEHFDEDMKCCCHFWKYHFDDRKRDINHNMNFPFYIFGKVWAFFNHFHMIAFKFHE